MKRGFEAGSLTRTPWAANCSSRGNLIPDKKPKVEPEFDSGFGGSLDSSSLDDRFEVPTVSDTSSVNTERPEPVGALPCCSLSSESNDGKVKAMNNSRGKVSVTPQENRPPSRTSPLKLSSTKDSTAYRFCGATISPLGSQGLVRLGSPETTYLVTPEVVRNSKSSQRPRGKLQAGALFAEVKPADCSVSNQTLVCPADQSPAYYRGFFDAAAAAATSTPLAADPLITSCSSLGSVDSHSNMQPSVELEVGAVSSLEPQINSQLARRKSPKTPSPFKKALAALRRQDQSTSVDDENVNPNSLRRPTLEECYAEARIPRVMPSRLTKAWFDITCGRTPVQQELTRRARQILRASDSWLSDFSCIE